MKRRSTALISVALLGVLAGPALAAFVSSTSNTGNSFSTRAIASVPAITGTRITTDPSCSLLSPAETIRQGANFYVCVQSITDPAGIATVTADVSSINGNDAAPLGTTGGPWSGYAWRSGALLADVPLATGSNGTYSVQANNNDGHRKTLGGRLFNIRSYFGWLRGEFGAAASAGLQQYYRLSETTGTGPNNGAGTYPATYNGTPTRGVAGALVGASDGAVDLNGGTDYISAARRVSTDFSFGIWVRGNATSGAGPGTVWSDSAGLVMMAAPPPAANNDRDAGIGVDTTGRIVSGCGRSSPSTGPVTIRSAAGALSDGNWHFVAFTRSAATLTIRLYVDGVQVASAANCSATAFTPPTSTWFGRGQESNLSVNAELDEAVVFSRVLTPAEVLDLYRVGTGS